ncbi:hypothetical protein V8G54_002967 [Vigna mungo]|uniref:Uncharacterized protein n=1 Tax=Vigna mungo TaxID=3915 RepID=A0AAQ3SCG6_VIGMU
MPEMYMRGAKRKTPCRRSRTDRNIQLSRCAAVRPPPRFGENRPVLDRPWRSLGDRSGDGGGDGVECPLLGSRLYGCIWDQSFHITTLSLSFSLPPQPHAARCNVPRKRHRF